MKINKKDILSSFTKYDERVQDIMTNTVTQLLKQEKTPNDYALVILQMLAIQYEIYFKAYDALEGQDIVNVVDLGSRQLHQTKPQLDVLQKANGQIIKLLDKLGMSPLENAKIKKLKEKSSNEENAEQLLNKLIND